MIADLTILGCFFITHVGWFMSFKKYSKIQVIWSEGPLKNIQKIHAVWNVLRKKFIKNLCLGLPGGPWKNL